MRQMKAENEEKQKTKRGGEWEREKGRRQCG